MKCVSTKCGLAAAVLALSSAIDCTPVAAEPTAVAGTTRPYSNFLPPLETLALPSEQGVLDRFMAKVRPTGTGPAAVLAAADEALAELDSPTRLRGYVEIVRARALTALHRDLDAVDAAEESAQLLPGYSAPLIAAFTLNAYLNRTADATEYLMRAIAVDPTSARTIDDYEIRNLMRRLEGFHDDSRARALSEKLLEIGWIGNHLDSRSDLAVKAIKLRLANGDVAGAKALVPKLLDPADSRDLLMMKADEPVWADIETWAGPRLEQQWPIYLEEAKERWSGARTSIAAHDYLSALKSAGENETAVRNILPMFDNPNPKDEELIFMVAPLANAMAQLGRWADAEALFDHAQQVWPLGSQANALNIGANYAVLLLNEGRPTEALQRIDASLDDTRRWGPQVGETALAAMHHQRACILHQLGRDSEAAVPAAQALAVERGSEAAKLHLCMGDPAGAKKALLDALGDEPTRDDVVRFMQPPDERPEPSDYARRLAAAAEALRSDPQIRDAVAQYGRILPWRLNDAAVPAQQAFTREASPAGG